jgi:hypothetical protein
MSLSYFDQQPGRRPSIGYGSQGYFPVDPEMASDELTPEQRESLLEMVGNRTMQGAGALLDLIDTPASWLRDIVSGNSLGSRTTPGEMLDSWGLRPDEDSLGGWGRPLAEFTAGAVVDPLLVLGGGLGKAGVAATKAGAQLGRSAQGVMGRQILNAADTSRSFTRNALDSWTTNFNGKPASTFTDLDLEVRPLVGAREAQRSQTLRQVADGQAAAARGGAYDALRTAAGGQSQLDSILDQPLRYDIGLKLPLSDRVLVGANLPGGLNLAQGLDRVDQAVRWSGVGRAFNALTDKPLAGALDEKGQIIGSSMGRSQADATVQGNRLVAQTITPAATELNQIADPRVRTSINQALRRALDGYPNPGDATLLAQYPETRRFVDTWHRPGGLREQMQEMRRQAGLGGEDWEDQWLGTYFPRHVNDENFLDLIEQQGPAASSVGSRAHSNMTGDQAARRQFAAVPGGTDMLNRLSRDSRIAGRLRTAASDDDAAAIILNLVNNEIATRWPTGRLGQGPVPGYTIDNARRLARMLHHIDPESVARGMDLYSASPLDDLSRYIVGNHRAAAVNNTTFDMLNGVAQPSSHYAVNQAGAFNPHDPLSQVLAQDLGIRTRDMTGGLIGPLPQGQNRFAGGIPQMQDRLQRFQAGPEPLDLTQVSVDQDTVRRITRMKEYYAKPELHNELTKVIDGVTRMWKGPLLAWPAKFARDKIGGTILNVVETGSPTDVLRGSYFTKLLVQGRLDLLEDELAVMPRYAGMQAGTRVRRYQEDLAAYDMMGRGTSLDLNAATQDIQHGTHTIDQFVPGLNPQTTAGYQAADLLNMATGGPAPLHPRHAAYSELGNAQNWSRRNFFGGLWDPKQNTNPITRYGARQGDLTDLTNRLTGYNAMLLQGADPSEAARRMKKLHIDYSTLTRFEKDYLRRLIPFYAYTSRMSANAAEMIYDQPSGRYTQLAMRLPRDIMGESGEGEEDYVPESIKQSYGFRAKDGIAAKLINPFGAPPDDVTPWVTDIDIPGIDQIGMFQPVFDSSGNLELGNTAYKSFQDAVGKNANPMLKAGLETLTGVDSFTKRPLNSMNTAANQLAEQWFNIHPDSVYGQHIRSAKPLLDMAPFMPRILQVANRLTDDEKVPDVRNRVAQMGINMYTGIKAQNVNDQTRRRDARKQIGEIVEQDPIVRSFTQPFIPKQALPYADPELVDLMALDRQLSRELKAEQDLKHGIIPTKKKRQRNTDPMSYFEG